MSIKRKNRIAELQWIAERNKKLNELSIEFESSLPKDSYSFLSFKKSDSFQLKSDNFPTNRWKDNLIYQTELSNSESIENILKSYISNIVGDYVYIFLMNYNFGIIKIKQQTFISHWRNILEIDKDEVMCYSPKGTEFISIEITEDFIPGRENEGSQWIYEVTFSNKKIKKLTHLSFNSNDLD